MDLQEKFLALIQAKIPKGEVLGNTMMKLLHISKDSAYRRIRGETSITFDELLLLANHFNISIDTFLKLKNVEKETLFHHKLFDTDVKNYINWVMKEFTKEPFQQEYNAIYAAKGLPVYYNFIFPEIAVFKAFYYKKILWQDKSLAKLKFDYDEIYTFFLKENKTLEKVKNEILMRYLDSPVAEIWNQHTLVGHLQQLSFSLNTDLFKNKKSAELIIEKTRELIETVQLQAEYGHKVNPEKPNQEYAKMEMYLSETVNLEHTFWRKTDETSATFTIANIGDFVYTYADSFCKRSEIYLKNLIQNSTKISESGGKERKKLFKGLNKQIDELFELI